MNFLLQLRVCFNNSNVFVHLLIFFIDTIFRFVFVRTVAWLFIVWYQLQVYTVHVYAYYTFRRKENVKYETPINIQKTNHDFNNLIVNAHCTFESIFLPTEYISLQFQTNLSRNFVFLKHSLYILYVSVRTQNRSCTFQI